MIKMLLDELINKDRKILVVGPHPDDIEFSTGRLILRRKGINVYTICISDGRKGQQGTDVKKVLEEDEYAQLRIKESTKALNELHIDINNMFFFNLPDQEIVSNPYVIDKLFLMIRKISPDFVLIPPWEGAHPDHDATHIFSVIAADNLGIKEKIIEYASYNNYRDKFNIQKFIPGDTDDVILNPIPNEQKRWLNIMRIFKSQKNQQEHYIPKSSYESFRKLPEYDYSRLPYSTKQSEIIRQLLNPVYPIVKKIMPKKMFYETWAEINPTKIMDKLNNHKEHYGK